MEAQPTTEKTAADHHEDQVADDDDDDEDLEKLQAEIARMEEQAALIAKENEELQRKRQQLVGTKADESAAKAGSEKTQLQRDGNSIYVGQVDYSTTPEELLAHFEACGSVERVTIVCDKFTGRPKGFAYLEFDNEAAVENAMKLDNSEFKGRNLKVTPKRVNQPGMGASAMRGGGRGFHRGGGRGGGFRGGGRGRGRGGFRGGGARGYHPYY
ncbi:hypothetical protein MPSEU_000694200 [Mayamaea pseudoterrestris]|nr:hypothetical protein MPSEU_000694200 [Mayamaea pseudoterrestris]